MKQEDVVNTLLSLREEEYKTFVASLVPNINPDTILGVRIPHLRTIARRIAKGDYQTYLAECEPTTYEEKMIKGFVIGMADMTFGQRCGYIKQFLSEVDNWGICDSFCSSLKSARRDPHMVWDWIELYFASKEPYKVRFAIVISLIYFHQEEYIEEFFEHLEHISCDDYYVKTAIAWAISVYYIKHPEVTKRYLKENTLDQWTYRKSLTKIIESHRVSEEDKNWIRSLRANIKK